MADISVRYLAPEVRNKGLKPKDDIITGFDRVTDYRIALLNQ